MEKKSKTFRIEVEGVVQGVGFRPFLYHLAKNLNLKGFVRNTRKGVYLEVTGDLRVINRFINDIRSSLPPLAIIKNLKSHEIEQKNFNNFEIISSEEGKESNIFLSPDVSICTDCQKDFDDSKSRFYKYPFVNCTNCGPRFSIILDYPYDRKNTTMNKFSMCPDCEKEYKNIFSRRYHAQPISCKNCGPEYKLYDRRLKEVTEGNVFDKVSNLISEGNIIAVKGIGGYHLILSAQNISSIKKLRERKKRDTKPFALLFKDLELVKKYTYVSLFEEEVLKSKEKPIVLLKKKKNIIDLDFDLISGNSPYYGVMLPYAPFHYLILDKNPTLICTSANISGEPIVYKEEDLKRIEEIADYFLIHNRDIERFVEDSVVRVLQTPFLNEKHLRILYRKSRGYAPSPLFLNKSFNKNIIGMGSDLKATISILREDNIIQSQYLGDLADYESFIAYQKTYEDIKKIYDYEPDIYVSDLHPSYLSTRFAEEISSGKELKRVQHHKAHIASVCLENNIFEEPVIGIALDGTGYGEDGMIWGGEIFLGSIKEGFIRAGHLSYTPFPFGDLAIKEPERTYLSYLFSMNIEDGRFYEILSDNTKPHLKTLEKVVKNANIFTSSTGRLFDCVSYLLGFRKRISYEGESAIELENQIYRKFGVNSENAGYRIQFPDKEPYIIDVKEILREVFQDWIKGVEYELISLKFHTTLVNIFCEIAELISKKYKIKKVVLSGGTFQNNYLLYNFFKRINQSKLTPIINKYSPPNDACISIGQCALGLY